MFRIRYGWITVLAIFCMVLGCEKEPTSRTVEQNSTVKTAPENSAETGNPVLEPGEEISLVARVNGEGITTDEFNVLYQHSLSQQTEKLSPSQKFDIRVNILNSLIMTRILKQKALAADLPVEATIVEKAFQKIRENFHFDDQAMGQTLAAKGYTIEQFRKTLENEIKVSMFQQMIKEGFQLKYTDADLGDWFESHRDSFLTPEILEISHIMKSLPEQPTQEEIDKANSDALKIREQIVKVGADFGEMARLYSDDINTATSDGYLGYIVKGQTVEPFEQAAFSLSVGGVSNPVRTYKGLHLIKLNSRKPAGRMTLEEVMESGVLEKDYQINRRTLLFRDWLAQQRNETSVEILDPNVVKIK